MKAFLAGMFRNWKTSSVGVGFAVTGIVHLIFALKSKTLTEQSVVTEIMSILGGIGLVAAGDAAATPPPPPPAPAATPQPVPITNTTRVEDRND